MVEGVKTALAAIAAKPTTTMAMRSLIR